MASSSQLVTLKTHRHYARGAELANVLRDKLFPSKESQEKEYRVLYAHTEDLPDSLINYPFDKEKSVKEGERAFDQTAKADKGKPRLSLVPTRAVEGIARIREYGCNKYPVGGEDNWKDVEPQRYIDALLRHAFAFKDDPCGVDEESGLPHLWHLGCNYAFLAELLGDEIDGKKM